jgi:hypothetical protein
MSDSAFTPEIDWKVANIASKKRHNIAYRLVQLLILFIKIFHSSQNIHSQADGNYSKKREKNFYIDYPKKRRLPQGVNV